MFTSDAPSASLWLVQQLIAATDERDAFTTFTGVTRLRQGQLPSGAPLNGSDVVISRSTSDPGVGGAGAALRKISPNPATSRYEEPPSAARPPPALARSQTQIVPGQYSGGPSAGGGGGLPQRGQSVRRADGSSGGSPPRPPVKLAPTTEEEKERAYQQGGGGSRVTALCEFNLRGS